jgi:lipopolysaccharide export system permease protein
MTLTLGRYIARRFAGVLAVILAALAAIVIIADYVEVLRRFGDETGFTAGIGLELVGTRVPLILDAALPFAFLFAAILSLLTLSRRSELVVARASGVSAWGFLAGPLVVALLVGIAATAVFNPLAVDLKGHAESLEAELLGRASGREAGVWFRQDGDNGPSIVHSDGATSGGLVLHGVTAFVFERDGAFREKVMAPAARFGDGGWILDGAEVVPASSPPTQVAHYVLPSDLTGEMVAQTVAAPAAASVWSLPGAIEAARRTGLAPDRFRLAFHELLARPVLLVAMVLIAASVSLRPSRFGAPWRLMLAGVIAGFLLYVLIEIVGDLGSNGIVDPLLAAWLPPIAALTFGATVLLYQEDG